MPNFTKVIYNRDPAIWPEPSDENPNPKCPMVKADGTNTGSLTQAKQFTNATESVATADADADVNTLNTARGNTYCKSGNPNTNPPRWPL